MTVIDFHLNYAPGAVRSIANNLRMRQVRTVALFATGQTFSFIFVFFFSVLLCLMYLYLFFIRDVGVPCVVVVFFSCSSCWVYCFL